MPTLDYTEEEWRSSAGHFPLRERAAPDLLLLHRHWMWANQQREVLDRYLETGADGLLGMGASMFVTKQFGFMFAWYGMLWAVVEACIDPREGRNVDIRGQFRADIDKLAPVLRPFRNAILHVPRHGRLLDERMVGLASQEHSAATLRRVSTGFGRLFLEEYERRRQSESSGVISGDTETST